jgi:hypothetical protein
MKKLLAALAGVALSLSLATSAFAWGNLTLTAECAPDQATFAWTINLPNENNFKVDWSFDSDFSTFMTIDFGSMGEHDFTTPRGGDVLYVRWSSEHNTTAQAASNKQMCAEAAATPTPTPEGSVMGGTFTSSPSPENNVHGGTGTPAPDIPDTSVQAQGGASAFPAVVFALIALGSLGVLAVANVKARH